MRLGGVLPIFEHFFHRKIDVIRDLSQSHWRNIPAFHHYSLCANENSFHLKLAVFKQHSLSGAKDDPNDAQYLAEIVSVHRDRLNAWQPEAQQTRELRFTVEHRRRLVADKVRQSNRLRAAA